MRGRGLKCDIDKQGFLEWLSPLMRGRGLKSNKLIDNIDPITSRPL